MNTCISAKRRNRSKNNVNSCMKNIAMTMSPNQGGGYLLQSYNYNYYFEEEEDFNTERETVMRIFMRYKYYRMKSNLSNNNSTMPRRRILMNTCISTKRRNRSKNNVNSGMKNITMTTMITDNMKTRRKSGTRYITGSLLRNLYCP